MKKTHFLSLLLTVVMLVTLLFPTGLFAEEVPAEDGAEETIVVTVTEDAPDASDEDDAAVTEEDTSADAADDAAAVTEEDADAEAAEEDGADDAAAVTEEDADAEAAEEDTADDAVVTEEDADAEAAEEDAADDDAVTEEDADAEAAEDDAADAAAAVTEEDAGTEAAEEDGADDDAVVTEEDETAASEEDGEAEAEAEEEDGEEDAAFAEGYVKVAGGTAVYASESKQDQLGAFTSDAAVYAVMSSPAQDEAFSWLKITFDTEEAKAAGDALLTGYVQFKDVSVLSDEAAAQLTVELLRAGGARSYGDHPLPAVAFEAKAEEAFDPAEDETVVDSDPVVTATVNCEVAFAGDYVEFNATVTGTTGTLTYLWQKSTDGETWTKAGFTGYKTATMHFDVIRSRLNYRYRCAVTDANGTWYSNTLSVQYLVAPVITATVNRDSAFVGDYLEFNVSVSGTVGTLTYLWQKSTDGETWGNAGFTGYKTATMHFDVIKSRLNYQYRCAVTDDNGTWYSNAVSVRYLLKPVITATANCEVAHSGENVEFTASCSNTAGTLTYVWQKSSDGSEWNDASLAGYNTAVMSCAATQPRLSYLYRCAVTDDNGTWYSNTVSVQFVSNPVITATVNREIAFAGDYVEFNATAEDTVGTLTYLWQKSTDGETWGNAGFAGYKTATMHFDVIKSRLNYQYRCAVTDDNGTWYSNVVSVQYLVKPVITATVNRESAFAGDYVEFNVSCANTVGTSLTYLWQKSTDGETWGNAGFTGYKTATMHFDVIKSRLSYRYRCAVTDNNGTWYSNVVSVQYLVKPVITATVNRESAFAGDYVEFNVSCANTVGTSLTYLWQKSTDGETWGNAGFTGYKTATMYFNVIKSRLNYRYRCAVTDDNGTWYSNVVSVQYLVKPVITATANCESASAGDYVEFTATCTNTVGTLKYLWQKSTDGETWGNAGFTGYKTATMHFDVIKSRLSYQYRCAVTDDNGTWYSNTVKVEYVRIIKIDGVTYEPITETTCRVVSYSGTASALVIPTEVEGMTVVEIGVEAFMGNTSLTSIDLPNTITVIKARAFKNCTNLTEMRTH